MTLNQLEARIKFSFEDKGLLEVALTHRSCLNENPKAQVSNERLEFLGDSVLEFIVSKHLFEKFSNQDEGNLTALRAKLVNTYALAEVAKILNLGTELKMSRGEEQGGGRENPGLLANTVEAILGAIFQDQGIEKAEEFVENFVLPRVHKIVKESLKDPKSMLQEFVQAEGYSTPVYRTIAQAGPDHARTFTVEVIVNQKTYATGTGQSKQQATQIAAKKALELWEKKQS